MLEDAAHFPAVTRPAPCPRRRRRSRQRCLGARGAADRRAVVADRRRDADGRNCAEHRRGFNRIARSAPTECGGRAGPHAPALDARSAAIGAAITRPAPTFTGATVGGTVATNGGGAATLGYGATRPWIAALTIVLPDGDVLDVRRGEMLAHADGFFDLALAARIVRIDVPAIGAAASEGALPGTLPRRDGSDRSVHRTRRDARRRHRA